ncbi:MAG: maltose ABC transporter permease MalF [Cellulomonas sp.]|uniref:Maltose/maltodextrin transport system permease protein n=1 Tax=Cellulomonas gelida TaxID=1712 RepID=A0A4Y3KKF5_9CELL|nr:MULTISPECIES: maltose ABC transporter permease MalF [Cellulomonas]KMM45627.1 maltose ABC transporter permease [Cellulomonas sp. A375-1]MCR6647853.1 maltose ABC transporter permease MalF [Cellulomonas sp.]MCR6703790.1 maltose ABC transporter permease MalF [Cellulomonas sp.]GEA83834.1 sugar ABC transporter permease [Cellulomonas gelida]GGL25693.1 sugar ABC transporter permease [Cellulomonas gelida]
MSQQTIVPDSEHAPPDSPPGDARPTRGDSSPARNFGKGFLVKLAIVALIDAVGLYGILTAIAVEQWAIMAFLALALVAVNWIYFSRRTLPAKYLLPGLLFLLVYVVFTAAYTGYVAFTNYGDGHNSTKQDAVAAILAQNEQRVEGSAAFPLTVLSRDDQLAFAIVRDGEALVGTAEDPLAPAQGAKVEADRVTEVPDWQVLGFAEIAQRQQEIVGLRVPASDDPADGSLRTQDASTGYLYESVMAYDEDADTMTNTQTGVVYSPNEHGQFQAEDGSTISPGWRVTVGFENFTRAFSDDRLRGPFIEIFLWNFAFALFSVLSTFVLGLFLAVVFNDPRVRGRKLLRALLILPYAVPAFLSALVWKGMLNTRSGFLNQVILGGADIGWLSDPWLAKLSVLGVNLWLGFPYMFIVCTGALQSIPSDVYESARMDGAKPWRLMRSITLPLLMVSVAPLLVASFAFNFNNFSLIYMLTGGGPNFVGTPVVIGHTDILISMVYSIAFESGLKQYGFASALSILIFLLVGAISWWGFRRTRRLEEL